MELDELSKPNHSRILQGILSPCSSPIIPLTVPKSTDPWVGVEVSPKFCMTRDPWQKTLTNSPRWDNPTSCRCCRSSSVVAALQSQTLLSPGGGTPKLSLAPKSWECFYRFPEDLIIPSLPACAVPSRPIPSHLPVLLAHKQIESILRSQEIIIIQDLHGTHPVWIEIPGNLEGVRRDTLCPGGLAWDPASSSHPTPIFRSKAASSMSFSAPGSS